MATREEIAKWINKYLTKQFICEPSEVPDTECLDETNAILAYLDSKDVVIKVKRECGVCGGSGKFAFVTTSGDPLTYEGDCLACKGTGKDGVDFVAVEPLIEGIKNRNQQ